MSEQVCDVPEEEVFVFPLSFAQQRLWFLHLLDPQSAAYNMPFALRLLGQLDKPALARTLNEIIRRHEVLRTTFDALDGEPVQLISASQPLELPFTDLSNLPPAQREAETRRLVLADALRPFDFTHGPMLRASLLQLGNEEHVLSLTMHHIVSDGWSMGVLVHEFAALYTAFTSGRPSPLPELPVQYADYVQWQREWLTDEVLAQQLTYWKRQLEDAPPVLELPADRSRPVVQSFRGATEVFTISPDLSAALQQLCQAEGVTLFVLQLAAFQALLYRYTGEQDVVVGSPVANRNQTATEQLIGFFINTLVLRTQLSAQWSFRELLAHVRETCVEALAHQDLPFEKLVEELRPERSRSHSPLFQVMFASQNTPEEDLELPGLRVSSLNLGVASALFDLTLNMLDTGEQSIGSLQYNTDLFDAETIRRMCGNFVTLLEQVVANPDQALSEIPLLTEAERHRLAVEWNQTSRDYASEKCLPQLFAAQVERTPDAPAVSDENRTLSYSELNARANQLAHQLRDVGVGPEMRVALFVERSTEMVVGILGILKAGAAFVPIDPHQPFERISFLLADVQSPVVVTQEHLVDQLPADTAFIIELDAEGAVYSQENPALEIAPENVAYVIYTSGSTGQPKGVLVEHRQLRNTMFAAQEAFEFTAADVMSCVAPYAFDIFYFELLAPLIAGSHCRLVTSRELLDADRMIGILENVTCMQAVPALMRQILNSTKTDHGPRPFEHVREIFIGGEAVAPGLLREMQHAFPSARLNVLYGPTEATIICSQYRVADAETLRHQMIGMPLGNMRLHVLDAHGNLVPIGVAGEIHIGGSSVTRGYFNRPELTAEKFIPDSFSEAAGARLYQSGDLGRYLPDGNIEFLGRTDEQVKVHGFRVEPAEIERALGSHPAVREQIVIVREDIPGDKRLVAYLVAEEAATLTGVELRGYLKGRLPEYMLPSAFVFLDALPLTSNAKVDRHALPAPDAARPELPVALIAPRTTTEEKLAASFAQVLNLKEVGIHDNFFDLGGHSLLATQLISRVREAFQIEVPFFTLFEAPTVAELAESIEAQLREGSTLTPSRPQRIDRTGPLPLSYAQQRLWFIHQLDPASPAYNVPLAVRLAGQLDIAALRATLTEVVRRHESLRTTFVAADDQPRQVIHAPAPVDLPVTDLSRWAAVERERETERFANEEACLPFDLAGGPLLRLRLLRLCEAEHVLLVTMHHIVSDGWSMGVLVREVGLLYAALCAGAESPLPELALQYADFAIWQREWLSGEVLERQLSYWREQLAGAPAVLELPSDRVRPAVQSFRGAQQSFVIPEQLTARLNELSRGEGVTLFMTLLAAFKALLSRYTGHADVVVGSPIAGRNFVETEELIGFFVNTLVLRTNLSGDPTFRELLGRVKEVALGAYLHQDVPFEKLVEELQPERHTSHSPLYQVMFELQNAPLGGLELPGVNLELVSAENATEKFDLTLNLQEVGGVIGGSLGYNTDLFEAGTIGRLVSHFLNLLEAALGQPDRRVSELGVLSVDEREQLVREWNDTESDYPENTLIQELFEQQVERRPDGVAVVFEGEQITYSELKRRADAFARRLRRSGVGPEMLVGVALERSLEMVVTLLGILKAGGAFVSFDLTYPKERLSFLFADTGVRLLVTQPPLLEKLPPFAGEVILPTEEVNESGTENTKRPGPDQLAYVFYTSGSTGQPKGVLTSHRGVVNYFTFNTKAYQLSDADTVLQLASLSFDASVRDILNPLVAGARLVLVNNADARDPQALLAKMSEQRVTCLLSVVPSLLHALTEAAEQHTNAPAQLRLILTSGENLLLSECAKARAVFGDALTIVNQYGATECTMSQSFYSVPRAAADTGTAFVGKPIANAQLYVLDERLNLVPIGVSGEAYIGCVGVARGYLNNPAQTAARFIPHPFSREPGARLYRTGDVARYRSSGDVELLGRMDHQVKLRGLRVELAEIEAALNLHEDVREAVVLAREDQPGEKRLVAYVVSTPDAGQAEARTLRSMRHFLKERLPDYMVPSAFVFLDALPLTPNGKVDRAALPAPASARPELEEAFAPARTPTEEVLAGLWAELLGVEQIGIHDNFFDVGGHSLLATQVISRVRQLFQVEIPLRQLFEQPTVAALAQSVDVALLKETKELVASPIERVSRAGLLPLSYAQQRLWFIHQLDPASPVYNIPLGVRLRGELDIAALRATLTEIVRRHEALRTTFSVREGQPQQIIQPPADQELPVTDLANLADAEQEAGRIANEEARLPFDLERGPLLRARLLRLSEEQHVLLVTMHHIVSDGWSMGVLVKEVAALYAAFAAGEPAALAELPLQYADYAVWQREWLRGEVLEQQLGYWREQLAGAPAVLELPSDHPRPALQSFRGSFEPVTVDAAVTERLKELSRREGVTLFMLLLGAWQVLLSRYTNAEEIVVGTPIANRQRGEVEGLIGYFVNALALRTDLSGDPTFRELLARVREVALGAYLHQDVPFEKLVEELQPERSLSYNPLFQVVFALENTPDFNLQLPGLNISGLNAGSGTAKFDLRLSMSEIGRELMGTLQYSTDLFEPLTIQRMLGHLQTLLASIANKPDARISELSLLSAEEEQQTLFRTSQEGGNAPAVTSRPVQCLHHLFEAQAARSPNAIAVTFENEQLTYAELNRRADQLADRLRVLGVGPESLVGLCFERSLELVVGILGILKAGGAYVPLDPSYPRERLQFMIEDAKPAVLLTAEGISVPNYARADQLHSLGSSEPRNSAYVIYTSGSTGTPKGVVVTHANVVRLFNATHQWFDFNENDVWTLFHSSAFDFSVWELWGALLCGGRLVVVPHFVSRSPEAFHELLSRERVTVLNQTPSAFRQLINADASHEERLSLRFVIFGGEALELQSLKPWFDKHGDAQPQLVNMYGITETTVHVTHRPLALGDLDGVRGSRIGRAIPDLNAYVLDRHLRPVPDMLPGELCVGGAGVARGYLNRPELCAERFVPDAFSGQPGARLYRSGDLVRRWPSGDLEYLGRIDQQVKIRGFRIELGEIEAVVNQHEAVREAVVAVREDAPGEKRLICYLVPADSAAGAPEADGLREFLRLKLPDYMVPSAFVTLPAIPLTPNGKVDRRALPAPSHARPALSESYQAPRNELERVLATMWRETLDVEQVGVRDNFFDLGGDSIRGAIFINQLQERLGEIVHVVVIFTMPSIEQLAQYLEKEYTAAALSRLTGNAPQHDDAAIDVATPITVTVDDTMLADVRRLIRPSPLSAATKNPPAIFILAPPRSGTTLLRVMLAGHPRLFAPPELELLSFNTLAERRAAFTGKDSFWLEGTLRAIMEIKGCDAEAAQQIMNSMEERGFTTRQCYRQLQSWLGERILVDKTPSYALDQAVLERAEVDFENALYVHLLRHPAGMIRSFEEAKLDQIFFRYEHSYSRRQLAEVIWTLSHQNIVEFLEHVPRERQQRVKFEDLLTQPQPEIENLCRFLGLDFHPDMLQPYKDRERRMTDGIHAESRMLGDVKFHSYNRIEARVGDKWKDGDVSDGIGKTTWAVAAAFGYEKDQRPATPAVAQKPLKITPLTRSGRTEFPLSFAQERLWFLDQMQQGQSATYNIGSAVRLHGALHVDALRQSLDEILKRHSALRTSFKTVDEQPVQVIAPPQPCGMKVVDLSELTETQREEKSLELATAEAQLPFDLARGPLLRATLLRLGEAEHVLLVTMHHIASDGWSLGVLVQEVETLYTAFSLGRPSPLPELPVQYADYAQWQREWLSGEVLAEQLNYWKRQLAGAPPVLELPTDRPRPAVQSFKGATEPLSISAATSESLKALSRSEGVTMFMLLLAAWQTLLHRYTGAGDIVVGSPIAGRNRAEVEPLIGFFVNTLVLRTDLSGNPRFREALKRVHDVTVGAFAHQDVPFEKLVEELQPERSLSYTPVVQVMFALQNAPAAAAKLPGLSLSAADVESATAKTDLILTLFETGQGILGSLSYDTALFAGSTIRGMVSHFERLLESIVAQPDALIDDLALISPAEELRILAQSRAAANGPERIESVPQMFESHVKQRPNALALTFADERVTYGELNARANQVAHYLRSLGAGPEVLVGIFLENSVAMIVALIGVLKSGAAYVPLDVKYPTERLRLILQDTRMTLLLTERRLLQNLPQLEQRTVFLDDEHDSIARQSVENLAPVGPANLAYIIYTSGSTGTPKGVMIEHRNIANQVPVLAHDFGVNAASRVLQFASFSFDASVFEIHCSLSSGATLCLVPKESLLPGESLLQTFREQGITTVLLPPSALAVMEPDELPQLQALLSGGEACSADIVRRWSPGRRFVNVYGPTETTVIVTCTDCVADEKAPTTAPTIGRAMEGSDIYILDSQLRPAPVGVLGEIFIGGAGVARGYLNRPELTAEKFMPHPFSRQPGARLYRTGDKARLLPSGEIDYQGRIDTQVKLRGFRIELGEIENALRQYPSVHEALVAARENGPGDKRLIAYVVKRPDGTATVTELREFLKERLPEYMVPSLFVFLEEIPLTPHGKYDRRALPLPVEGRAGESHQVAPRDVVELQLTEQWEELLRVPCGVTDDFFELGGHSLLAVRLMSRIEQLYGKKIPLATLFKAPTIESLSTILRHDPNGSNWSPLVAIQPHGSERPFFCVHPVSGNVLCYRALAQRLGQQQPFYALQARGLDDEQEPRATVAAMAADYLAAVRTVQPDGPYLLGGWSMGGLIAFEMAKQLQAQGEEVQLLALIDTKALEAEEISGEESLLASFALHLGLSLEQLRMAVDAVAEAQPEDYLAFLLEHAKAANIIPHDMSLAHLRQQFNVFKVNVRAAQRYRPAGIQGNVVLFRATERRADADPTLGWSELGLEKIVMHDTPGTHLSMVREPFVSSLAEKLAECLGHKKAQKAQEKIKNVGN